MSRCGNGLARTMRQRWPKTAAPWARLPSSSITTSANSWTCAATAGAAAPADLTTRLLTEQVDGRPLTDDELVSLLRNWTVGELGTIAASVGIVAHYFSTNSEVQSRLRTDLSLLPAAIDEILRMHASLIYNRRFTTRPTDVGDQQLEARHRLTLLWASANRD
jgi:cytochrome P450